MKATSGASSLRRPGINAGPGSADRPTAPLGLPIGLAALVRLGLRLRHWEFAAFCGRRIGEGPPRVAVIRLERIERERRMHLGPGIGAPVQELLQAGHRVVVGWVVEPDAPLADRLLEAHQVRVDDLKLALLRDRDGLGARFDHLLLDAELGAELRALAARHAVVLLRVVADDGVRDAEAVAELR